MTDDDRNAVIMYTMIMVLVFIGIVWVTYLYG